MREISRIWQLLALVFVCMFVLSGLAGAVLNNSEGLNSIEAERSTDLKELESASKTDSITETQEDITSDDRSPHDPQKDREDRAREEKEPRPDREKRDRTDRPERPERDERPERRVKDKRDYVERQRPVRPEQEAYVNSYDETEGYVEEYYYQPSKWLEPIVPDQKIYPDLPDFSGSQDLPATLGMEINGPITTQTWTEALSPYYITENLTILSGETLTIDPGVQVIFNGSYYIWVEGTLWANGTALKIINFTSNQTIPSPGDWGAIKFNNTANGRISYSNLSYARNAVIINSTPAVIEIDNSMIFGSADFGILAFTGGFNIHDNIFATLNYAVHIDIFRVNSGSFNTGDILIMNNNVLGVSGFQVKWINFQDPLPDSDIVVGELQIINNTIDDIANAAISIQGYMVTNMLGGNITWGEVVITDNNITTTAGDGILINKNMLFNITNVNVTIGGYNITGNDISSSNDRGINKDFGNLEELYGTTNIDIGRTIIFDNEITADSAGVDLYWNRYGYTMDHFATISLDDTIISENTIDSVEECIYFNNDNMANYMYNDTSFLFSDLIINDNVLDSSSNSGIYVAYFEVGLNLFDNAMFTMGDFMVKNNDITAFNEGIYFNPAIVAYNMYNDTTAYLGDTELINNTIDATAGAADWGIEISSDSIGYQTHGNAIVTIGTRNILWNNITSEWGLYTGANNNGYEVFDNSELIYHDWNIMHNTIVTTVQGMRFDYTDCASYLSGNSDVSIGNTSVMYNNVTSQASYSYYLYYNYIGYRMWDNSTLTVGWMDTSHNNFSSTGGQGMDLWIYDFGRHMLQNTSAEFGDFYFTYNDVWSTNNNGLDFSRFQDFAYTNEGNSSVTVGDVLVNYNNITTGQDGLVIGQFSWNGVDMQDNSTALFGNCEFNNNTIDAGDDGIYSTGQFRVWGYNLYDYSQVTVGYCQLNDNTVLAGNEGINFQDYREKGYNMHGHTQFSMGNVEICRNTINSSFAGIYHGNYEYMGYKLYDNASASFSDFIFNDNVINASNKYGIYCYNIDGNGAYMEDNSTVTIGTFQWKNNNITGSSINGLYIQEYSDNGYQMKNNASVVMGTFEIIDNWINTGSGSGIYFNNVDFCGYYMYDNTTFTMGDWLINDNTVWSTDPALYFDLQGFGHYMYGNSKASIGKNEITGNYFNSTNNYGVYSRWWYRFGENINDNASVSVGDGIIVNNNISAHGWTQALQTGPYQAGYSVSDNASAYFGDYIVSDNTIYSNNHYGISLYYYYVGNDLEPNNYPTCAAIVEVGDFLVTDNDITSSNSDGMYLDFEYCGYELYDDAVVTLGSIELCRNSIHAENGAGIDFGDPEYFGAYMYDGSSFVMGDVLMNDNTIVSDGYGIDFEPYEFGYYLYDNASVTFGMNEVSRNTINSTKGYGIYTWWWYEFAYYMFENATCAVGDCIIDSNNVTVEGSLSGIYTGPYEGGYYVYDNSSAIFGDYIIINNQVRTNNSYAMYLTYYYMGLYLQPNQYSTCAGSVIVGDLIANNNEITSLNSYGLYLEFDQIGYEIYNDSYVTVGNVEICNNTISAPSGYGTYFTTFEYFGAYMYDNASFSMGDWFINDNTVRSQDDALHIEPYYFGYEMYDDSVATFGTLKLLRNYCNSTDGSGLYCRWWFEAGYNLYENAQLTMGDCIIRNNDVSSQNNDAMEAGPYYAGMYVYDNASAIFGDYIVSDNTAFANSGVGLYYNYYGIGYTLQLNLHSTCTAYVEVGDMKINNNDVTTRNDDGIYFNGRYVGYLLYDNASVLTGNIQINDNTVHSYSYSIYLNYYRNGYNLYDNASTTLGTMEIDNNDLNSTDDDCLSFYINECFYDVNNNASYTHGDIFITDNILKNTSVGIEFQVINSGFVIDNATAAFGGLYVTGNTVGASGDAIYYRTFQTPYTSSPNGSQDYGDVTIADNDLDSGSKGAYIEWQDPDYEVAQPTFFLSNNDIHDGDVGSTGIYMMNIQNSYLEQVTIDNFDYGVYANNSNITEMINSTVSTIGILDFNITSGSYIYTLNTTFNKASVVYEDAASLLEVAWYMHVQVNYQTNAPAPKANLTVTDGDSTGIYNGKTDGSGQVNYLICRDYDEDIKGIIKSYNDYSVNADDSGMFCTANPTMDQTKQVIVTLMDIFAPVLLNDSSDTAGTTGELFHFNVSIVDNLGMGSVHVVWWFGSDAPENFTMDGTGPYNRTIDVPWNRVAQLHYYFTASDMFGNWLNVTQVDVDITDNDPPFALVDTSDATPIMDEDFDFEASASDYIGVTEIHVVWWFDTGSATNDTMTGTGPYDRTIPIPATSVQTLHYYFTVTDAAGNWITGPTVDLDVVDIVPPSIKIESPADDALVSGTIQIQVNASDENKGISYVAVLVLPSNEIYNSTPTNTTFLVNLDTTTLTDGEYTIKAIVFDLEGLMNFTTINITIDNTPPTVNAGADVNVLVGTIVDFDGSNCSDTSGIVNYTWTFTYDGSSKVLYGLSLNFKFDLVGNYTVTLEVTDLVGLKASDTMVVKVTKPVPPLEPKVEETVPIKNSTDVSIDTTVTITFDIPMNTASVEGALDISPAADYDVSWNLDNNVITITFKEDLDYDKTYTITINITAKATTNGLLQATPYVFSFTTKEEVIIQPEPSITIESPGTGTKADAGGKLTISGTSTDVDEGTVVTVTIDDKSFTGTVSSDGSWSIEVEMPTKAGDYSITVEVGDLTESLSLTVEEKATEDDKKEEKDDYTMMILAIIIVIIIIILLLGLLLRKKKDEEEAEPEEEEAEADEEDEELEDEELEDEELEDEDLEEEEVEDEELIEEEEPVDEETEEESMEEEEPALEEETETELEEELPEEEPEPIDEEVEETDSGENAEEPVDEEEDLEE